MEGWHDVLLNGDWPAADLWYSVVWTAALMALGWVTFRLVEDSFADIV